MFHCYWKEFLRQLNISYRLYSIPVHWNSDSQILEIVENKKYQKIYNRYSVLSYTYLGTIAIGIKGLNTHIGMVNLLLSLFFTFALGCLACLKTNYLNVRTCSDTVSLFNVFIQHESGKIQVQLIFCITNTEFLYNCTNTYKKNLYDIKTHPENQIKSFVHSWPLQRYQLFCFH